MRRAEGESQNSSASRRGGSTGGFHLPPAAGAVVGDDCLERSGERRLVDGLALAYGHGSSGLVVVAAGDNALGVRHDPAVVEKDVNVVLGREQGADVALQH